MRRLLLPPVALLPPAALLATLTLLAAVTLLAVATPRLLMASDRVQILRVEPDRSLHLLALHGGVTVTRAGDDAVLAGLGLLAWELRHRKGLFVHASLGGGGAPDTGMGVYRVAVTVPLFVKQDERMTTIPHSAGFISRGFKAPLPRTTTVGLHLGHSGRVVRWRADFPVLYLPDGRLGVEVRRETWGRVRYRYDDDEYGRWSARLLRVAVTARGGGTLEWLGGGLEAALQFAGMGGGLQFGVDLEFGGYLPSARTDAMRRAPVDPESYMLPDEGLDLASAARVGIGVTMGVQLAALPPRGGKTPAPDAK